MRVLVEGDFDSVSEMVEKLQVADGRVLATGWIFTSVSIDGVLMTREEWLATIDKCKHGNIFPHSIIDPRDGGGFGPRPRVTCPGVAIGKEQPPCPACNDDGILHDHEGRALGPCFECADAVVGEESSEKPSYYCVLCGTFNDQVKHDCPETALKGNQ